MFNFSNIMSNLPIYLMRIPVVLLALTVHETAHGFMAYKLGDPTAKMMGRLSLNPLKHLDIMGTISLFLFGFGWAQPVPIDVRYFKKPKRDMALTALAGPLSNLIMAFVGVLLYRIAASAFTFFHINNMFAVTVLLFFQVLFQLNVGLAVFNLLPIPPLDGSRVFLVLLPEKYYFGIMRYERIIMAVLMVLMMTGVVSPLLSRMSSFVIRMMDRFISFVLPFLN